MTTYFVLRVLKKKFKIMFFDMFYSLSVRIRDHSTSRDTTVDKVGRHICLWSPNIFGSEQKQAKIIQ